MIGADEMSLLPLVALGDREACAVMRDGLLMAAQTATVPILRADAMSKAEVLSRMAAATGDAGDQVTLAAVLLLQSAIYRDQGCADQGLAFAREADAVFLRIMQADDDAGRTLLLSVVSSLADNGDDLAALMLDNLVASMPAKVAAGASAAVRRLDAAHG